MIPERPPQPLRILIASGDALIARRLLGVLVQDDRVETLGAAATATELDDLAAMLSPDVVVIDVALSPRGPFALLDIIGDARAILLVESPLELEWDAPAAARVMAFIGRNRPLDEIAESVVDVAALALALAAAAARLEPTPG